VQDSGGSFTFVTSNRIKRLSADLSTITPVAGTSGSGSTDGAPDVASFNQPFVLAEDSVGIIYVADFGNNTIRRIAADGTVGTLAGLAGSEAPPTARAAPQDSPLRAGSRSDPTVICNVADSFRNLNRRVTTAGVVTTYAGDASSGYLDGPALTAKFNRPWGVAVAANGDVLVTGLIKQSHPSYRAQRQCRRGSANACRRRHERGDKRRRHGHRSRHLQTARHCVARQYPDRARRRRLGAPDRSDQRRRDDADRLAHPRWGYADGTATTARTRDSGYGVASAANGGFMLCDQDGLRLVSAAGDVRTIATSRVQSTPRGGSARASAVRLG